MSKQTHYVGRVVVEAITVEEPTTSGGRYADSAPANPRRTKHTVATLTLGAENVETLVSRIGKHLELVEDGGDVDG